jgi:hypothetical protein
MDKVKALPLELQHPAVALGPVGLGPWENLLLLSWVVWGRKPTRRCLGSIFLHDF